METLLRLARVIDRLSNAVGRGVSWLSLAMVLVGTYNTVARYAGRSVGTSLSSNAYIELQWYLFSLLFLLGGSYALSRDSHVRVDVLYGRLGRRTRAWIDLVGGVLFLVPFTVATMWFTWPAVHNSWAVAEGSPDPGGLPRYPIKTAILIGLGLLLVQGVATILHRIAFLRGHEPLADPGAPGDHLGG